MWGKTFTWNSCAWHHLQLSLHNQYYFSVFHTQCKNNNFGSWLSLRLSVPVVLVSFLNFPKSRHSLSHCYLLHCLASNREKIVVF